MNDIILELLKIFTKTFFTVFFPYLASYLTVLASITNTSQATDRFWYECHHKMYMFFTEQFIAFNEMRSHVRVSVLHQDEESGESRRQADRLAMYLHIHSKALKYKRIFFDKFKIICYGLFISLVLSCISGLFYLLANVSLLELSLMGVQPFTLSMIVWPLIFLTFTRLLSESKNSAEDLIEESKTVSRKLGFKTD